MGKEKCVRKNLISISIWIYPRKKNLIIETFKNTHDPKTEMSDIFIFRSKKN